MRYLTVAISVLVMMFGIFLIPPIGLYKQHSIFPLSPESVIGAGTFLLGFAISVYNGTLVTSRELKVILCGLLGFSGIAMGWTALTVFHAWSAEHIMTIMFCATFLLSAGILLFGLLKSRFIDAG